MALASTPNEPPWYAAFPSPRSTEARGITREALLKKLEDSDGDRTEAKNFLLVDLRRTDYEGGTIRGSINLPAQSLYPTIPSLYGLFKEAGVCSIIWYCGSSRGRGTRAAGWFQDYLEDCRDTEMESLVLLGGVAGWAKSGAEYVRQMQGYTAEHWGKP